MAKICSTCHAENRDEAQFCRSCGTPLAVAAPAHDAGTATAITCTECGFANKPGVRYCAKCGVNLMGTVVVPRSRQQVPGATTAPAPFQPAPLEPQWPAAPAPAHSYPPLLDSQWPGTAAPAHSYPLPFDPLPLPDVPDPQFAIDVEREEAASLPLAAIGFSAAPPPAPRRTALWASLGVAVLVAAGVAWWFLSSAPAAPAQPAATAPPAALTPEPQPAPQAAEVATPPAPMATPATSGADVTTPAQATLPSTGAMPPPASPAVEAGPPNLGANDAASPNDAEVHRLAAEKKAHEKAARDKAEREAKAKAKAAAEQRDQAAARLKAEQDAARKRAEDQRPRQATSPPAPTPAVTAVPAPQVRTVRDICAGRNMISQSVCESRECGAPEHAGEAICKQVRDNEERRRGN